MKKSIALIFTLLFTVSVFSADMETKMMTSSLYDDQSIEVTVSELEDNPNMVIMNAEFTDQDGADRFNVVVTKEQLEKRIAERFLPKAKRNAVVAGVAGTMLAGVASVFAGFVIGGMLDGVDAAINLLDVPGAGKALYYGSIGVLMPAAFGSHITRSLAGGYVGQAVGCIIIGGIASAVAYKVSEKSDEAARSAKLFFVEEEESVAVDMDLEKVFKKIKLLAK